MDMDASSRSIARVVAVLEQLSVAPQPQSNLDLAHALGVPPSSMHRLLRKLVDLRYVECDPDTACYSVGPSLGELGNRLGEVGGYSKALQSLMSTLREMTGDTISIWIPSGAHVRISALLVGKIRGQTSYAPGELQEPFSTPGLALAANYSAAEVRTLIAQARRRHVPLGRRFKRAKEINKAIDDVARRGYAVGYNMKFDGWGMLAWPITLTKSPLRFGALAVGSPVHALRQKQAELVSTVERLRAIYAKELGRLAATRNLKS
jgi:IclR family acetate operon transcriptional repressor